MHPLLDVNETRIIILNISVRKLLENIEGWPILPYN